MIKFEGKRIDRLSPEQIVRMGVCHVPEGRQLFTNLTVLENLRLGAYLRHDGGAVRRDLDRVFSYFPALERRLKLAAGLFSGGEQQMLAIGRALMTEPAPAVCWTSRPSVSRRCSCGRFFRIIRRLQ